MLQRVEIEKTPVSFIDVGPRRRLPSATQIAEMAESLKMVGLLTPILVRLVYDDPTVERADSPNHIELVCGATRLEAAMIGDTGAYALWSDIDIALTGIEELLVLAPFPRSGRGGGTAA